jgi:hypothetical protein
MPSPWHGIQTDEHGISARGNAQEAFVAIPFADSSSFSGILHLTFHHSDLSLLVLRSKEPFIIEVSVRAQESGISGLPCS